MHNLNKKEYYKPEVSELSSGLTESGKVKGGNAEQTMTDNGLPSNMGPS